MPGFETEPWEIASAAGVVRDVSDELRAGLSRLDLDVETLLDGWRGQAGAAFANGWHEWQVGASDVLGALDMMAQLLDATAHGYDTAESASVSAFV
ncbi:MAG: WXG100 family type VII secretion target [Jatrophihabitantaceae bacterium]